MTMRRALVFSLALAVSTAHAQFANTTTSNGPDSASSSGSASPQMPQITVQPVQTPMITNNPAVAGAVQSGGSLPNGVTLTPAQMQRYQQLQQQQQGQQLLPLVAPAQAVTVIPPSEPLAVETNDFQDLIRASTGQQLPLYGYDLFRAPTTFAPVDNVPVTPEYLIGPGDELLIRAWGQIDIDYRAVVDRNGVISIPRVGTVPVAGLKYAELTDAVKKAVSKNFRNFQLLVTMGQLRSIQIFVVGQARRPGAYTVSSLSTLVNAVFAAGGPTTRGSMRSIQLKRGSQVVTELDLYDLLLRGDKSKDAPLLPGDVIYFPPSGPLAAVSGNVKNPAIYELKGPAVGGAADRLRGRAHHHRAGEAGHHRAHREPRPARGGRVLARRGRHGAHHQGRRPGLGLPHLAQVRERRHPARPRRAAAALSVAGRHARDRPDPEQGSADHAGLLPAQEQRACTRPPSSRARSRPPCGACTTRSTGTTRWSSA